MEEANQVKLYCGSCPDSHCGKSLYFIAEISKDIECTNCGQRHAVTSLLNVRETDGSSAAVGNLLKSMLLNSNTATKKGTELVKVRGLSNYHCKLVSHLLTSYGMDRHSGEAKLLSELGRPKIFDCSVLGNRAFFIDKEHLDIEGYGKDKNSLSYLKATLELIEEANDHKSTLVPLHADGDGHCLVHAISRAVVGRELLWHSLRQNLKDHLEKEICEYKAMFCDFIDDNEWRDIIAEADPDYHPGTNEPFGLRNIHVFGLANVLHRPIILLDSTEGMQSCGDYSGLFLPALVPSDKCQSQGVFNKPLVVAWSSSARNHYVPLIGVKGSPLPRIPQFLLPKAWGQPDQLVSKYIDFGDDGCCMIGGSRCLQESYIERLVSAMDKVFFEKYQVSPQLVADVNQFIYKPSTAVGCTLLQVTEYTQEAVESGSLHRCLSCQAVQECEQVFPLPWLERGGKLYNRVQGTKEGLIPDAIYTFTENARVPYMYDAREDILKPYLDQNPLCALCSGALRQVYADGAIRYANGDRTSTISSATSACSCGYKHYWDGKEYDNLPKRISVPLEWNGRKIEETVAWFENESDPSLNSNAYEIATSLVLTHFPGEFGSEVLVQKVVNKILMETAVKRAEEAPLNLANSIEDEEMSSVPELAGQGTASKIILTGPKKKTLHKEELTKNDCEKLTKARVTHHAAYSQKRKTTKDSPEKKALNSKLGKQELSIGSEKSKPVPVSEPSVSMKSEPVVMDSGVSKPRDRKIRLSSSGGRQATISLNPSATYRDLQEAVFAQLGIPKGRQKFRYGFPPRELKAPEDENDRLPLTHGDRVSVEELPEKMDQELASNDVPPEEMPLTESMEVSSESNPVEDDDSSLSGEEFEGINREQLATELMNLLTGALNVDRWETLQHQPEQFARGGEIYERVVSQMGPLRDGQQYSVTELPRKTFAYNAKKDRLEICLGSKHIPVQPLDPTTLAWAHARTGDTHPTAMSTEETHGLGAFSGVLRHRDAAEGRTAFSGMGRTLGGSEKPGDEKSANKEPKSGIVCGETGSEGAQNVTTHVDDGNDAPMAPAPGKCSSSTQHNVDNQGNKDEGETMMDTGGVGEHTNQIESTDVEMKAADAPESEGSLESSMLGIARGGARTAYKWTGIALEETGVAHEETGVAHEETGVAHEETGVAHKETGIAHQETGVVHKETGVAHKETGVAHEDTGVAHEDTGVAHEDTGVAHEDTGVAHEDTGVAHEETGVAHEETGVAHEETGVAHEETGVAHEETGVAHEETGVAHEETGVTHEETGVAQEETGDAHEETGVAHEESGVRQEETGII